jgi:aminoglycoside/choline kinase family phosphotransferase
VANTTLTDKTRAFLDSAGWNVAVPEPLTGDASTRKYFRLRNGRQSAILMNASQALASVAPFIRIDEHLVKLDFSAPAILARDDAKGLLLLEDFGDATFARLLDDGTEPETLFTLATDVLIALHKHPQAVPGGLRMYHPEKMLEDIELFLDWRAPGISETGRAEFRKAWREVLPLAHQVPASLLLRDYHVANLMLLPERTGIRQAGLLDFQDAYQGPVTYDLVSLLEDARRDVPERLQKKMVARYLAEFPALDRNAFETSSAILASLRHTRVLAIFERLSRQEGKHDYRRLHSPRVERLLQKAFCHPRLAGVKQWFDQYARQN